MTVSYPATEARKHFHHLLAAVLGGDVVVITKHGREIARLVPPATSGKKKRVAGSLRGLVTHVSDDLSVGEDAWTLHDDGDEVVDVK